MYKSDDARMREILNEMFNPFKKAKTPVLEPEPEPQYSEFISQFIHRYPEHKELMKTRASMIDKIYNESIPKTMKDVQMFAQRMSKIGGVDFAHDMFVFMKLKTF